MTQTRREFLRLIENEPLTLSCSALADFLWEDFVRDQRPSVNYLINTYKITQLSRFGKELFERLYNEDNVKWLISEQDVEDYFRAVCDGVPPKMPEGYKPENGVWWAIMQELTNAAGWPLLLNRCVGDQFASGNNAVMLLNELSEEIEEAITEGIFDVELLTQAGDKLQELREKFRQAVKEGKADKAASLRQQAKEMINQINDAVQQAAEQIGTQTSGAVDRVNKAHDDLQEQMGNLFGDTAGTGMSTGTLAEKKALAKRLSRNQTLRKVAERLGTLRRIWAERKRARKAKSSYENIVGAKFDNNVVQAFPSEIALAATPQGRALFALKYSERTLLTKDYTANRKDLGKGPIVMYVDVSGSMTGSNEIWSKAITFVIAEEALKQNRTVQINLFDTHIQNTVTIKPNKADTGKLLDFVGDWFLQGGTSFNSVIGHALSNEELKKNSDVLMITDGESAVNDAFIKRIKSFKEETGTQWTTFCIARYLPPVVATFSDESYLVDTSDDNNVVDVIQKAIR